MPFFRRSSRLAALLAAACAPGGEAESDGPPRGDRGAIMAVDPAARAAAYAASLHQAFEIGPSLVLMLDRAKLPASGGYAVRDSLPAGVMPALRETGTIHGSCTPAHDNARAAPVCEAPLAGYAVRFSDLFSTSGDSVRLYVAAEKFRLPSDGARYAPRFAFEDRYTLVRRDGRWSVVRKERKRIT